MPKTLKELYNEKMRSFDERRSRLPVLDLTTPGRSYGELLDNVLAFGALEYEQHAFCGAIEGELGALSDEKLGEVYDKLKTKDTNQRFTKEHFIRVLREHSGTSHYDRLFKIELDYVLDVFGEALGPQAVEKLASLPPAAAPTDPAYKGRRRVQPYGKELASLEKEALSKEPDEAKQAEIRSLLQRTAKYLEDIDPDLREYISHVTQDNIRIGNGFQSVSFKTVMNHMPGVKTAEGIRQLGGGKFLGIVEPKILSDGTPSFDTGTPGQKKRDLTEAEKAELSALSSDGGEGLSPETLDAVASLEQGFRTLDYSGQEENGHMISQAFPHTKHPAPDKVYYSYEQSDKHYAFWPLTEAKKEMYGALRRGDLEGVRKWTEEFEARDKTIRSMMDTVHSDKLSDEPCFSGNMDSTRSSARLVPEQYVSDFPGHNKLNCLYMAYGFSQNTDITMTELAKDPFGVPIKAARKYLEANGTDARPESIGAALALNTKELSVRGNTGLHMKNHFNNAVIACMERGVSGILGLEKDAAKRSRFLALQQFGIREGCERVAREAELMDTLCDVFTIDDPEHMEKRGAIYTCAAILPETGPDRFNMQKIADSFSKEDWQPGVSVKAYMRGEKPVDYAALAQRNQKIIEDMEREQRISGNYRSSFRRDEYLLNAFRSHSQLLKNAPAEERGTEGYEAFRKSVEEMYTLAESESVKALLYLGGRYQGENDLMAKLKTGKQDQLRTSDSDEYKQMKRSLGSVQELLAELQDGGPTRLARIAGGACPRALQKAADDTLEYFRMKTDNGKKGFDEFHYRSGAQRARESLETLTALRQTQDAFGLRSPARKMYEDAQLELMLNRRDKQWMAENGARCVSQMLAARSCLDSGIPEEEQKLLFASLGEESASRYLQSETIQRYVRDGSIPRLAESAIDGKKPFAGIAAAAAIAFREQYDRNPPAILASHEKRNEAELYAYEAAARELGIGRTLPGYSRKNPAIRARAEEILQRPEFRESMDRVLQGKTAAEMRTARKDDYPENRQSRYLLAAQSIRYEKRCARIATEAMLKEKGIRGLSEDKIADAENDLRMSKQFQAVCAEAIKGKNPDEIRAMTAALDQPEIQRKTAETILGSVTGGRQGPEVKAEAGAQLPQPERSGDDAGIGMNP